MEYMKPVKYHKYALCLNLYVPEADSLFKKYSLTHFEEPNLTQIMFLPHITKEIIDEFLDEVTILIN